MSRSGGRVALITGANAGIGKELARRLAVSGEYQKIFMACRNRARSAAAQAELEAATDKAIFEVILVDDGSTQPTPPDFPGSQGARRLAACPSSA